MQVLLIGNMGLYDYRPYVKKISNDRQIMYDCEKEYRLDPGKYSTGWTQASTGWAQASTG